MDRVRSEWPPLSGLNAVLLVNARTGKIDPVLTSTRENPRFFSTGFETNKKVLWLADSVRKELIGFDLATRRTVKAIDFRPVTGGWRGMRDSFDTMESVSVVPG